MEQTRSPSSALFPFLGEGSPTKIDKTEKQQQKTNNRVPTYSNLKPLEDLAKDSRLKGRGAL